ncbi:MAG: hypothetical protein KHW81_15895 [[Clostridium] innocuum]|nr:hypothetical protein [[Clostridium] innocuum]
MKKSNSKSRSEFIEKAVLFYISSLATKDDVYLPSAMTSVLQAMIDNTENRQSKLLFKLAVEIDIMAHVLASAVDLEPVQLDRIRGFCVEEVKHSIGDISLVSAIQKEDENES